MAEPNIHADVPQALPPANYSSQLVWSLLTFPGGGRVPLTNTVFTWTNRFRQCSVTRLHRISTTLQGLIRIATEFYTPRTRAEINEELNNLDPFRSTADYTGQLPFRVQVASYQGGSYWFLMDGNQQFQTYAAAIDVMLLGSSAPPVLSQTYIEPPPTFNLGVTIAGRTSYDAIAGVEIAEVEDSFTPQTVKYTQLVTTPTVGALQVLVPPRAVSATIRTTFPVTSWQGFAGAISPEIVNIPFTNGRAEFEVGRETYIQSDLYAMDPRSFEIVWRIRT